MIEPMRPTGWKVCTLAVWYWIRFCEESADEGADDAEHDGADDPDGVTARHKQARDRADDKPHDQQDDDEDNHAAMTSLGFALYSV